MITLVLIGLVGGLSTGVSPCVLPVLPVVFLTGGTRAPAPAARPGGAKAEAPTRLHAARARRRPSFIVAGLALGFSVFTLLGTLVLGALPAPQDIVRWTGWPCRSWSASRCRCRGSSRCWSGRSRSPAPGRSPPR